MESHPGHAPVADSSRPDFWDERYRNGVTPWDFGRVPADLRTYLPQLGPGARVLVPGCGSAHEVYYLAENGIDVLAVDFSAAAVEAARRNLGCFSELVQMADVFEFDAGGKPFDVLYERAFLCALPRKLWPRYGPSCAQLLRPGGHLAGFFFYGTDPKGPPFGTSPGELHALLDPFFEQIEDRPAVESLAVFGGGERWQVWRRR
jgi:SAM-dependent methyltransferase